MTGKPWKKAAGVTVAGSGGEHLFYVARTGKAVILNPTAFRIWELCDGTRDAAQIAMAVRNSFDATGNDEVEADVTQALHCLREQSLVTWE